MARRMFLIACLVFASTVSFMMGCSGTGVPTSRVRAESLQSTAAGHLTAVALVKGWIRVLYPRAEASGGSEMNMSPLDCEALPDGGMRCWGVLSDGAHYDYTTLADGSGYGTHQWPDGTTKTYSWSAPLVEDRKVTVRMEESFSDGRRLDYTWSADWARAPAVQTWVGAARLPGGRAMEFTLNRQQEVADQLELSLPDGGRLALNVPLTAVAGAEYWPVFTAGAQGFFVPPVGQRQEFQLVGNTDRWVEWRLTMADGTEGSFGLGDTFEGSGQLTKGGESVGVLTWSESSLGTLTVLNAASVELTPSAAARDFQMDQWVHSIAAMGPAPIY